MFQTIFSALGRKLGVIVVPEWRAVRIDEERHLARLLAYLQVDCVFDVGANVGQYGNMLRKYVGYQGRILSFEPNPVAAEKLEAAASKDPLWHVERLALGSSNGTAEFHSPTAYNELGSLRSFSSSHHSPKGLAEKTFPVQVQTLESYLELARAKYDFKRPFLKLDTQGFDTEVVKGAGSTISQFLGLQSEIAFQQIYEGAPGFYEAIQYYQSLGFVISRMVPIHEIHFPDLVEMDVILVRSDQVNQK